MAGTAGSGTPGANQNGATAAGNSISEGAHTPGEVLNTGFGAANSASTGPNIFDEWARLQIQPAFDLAIAKPLRDKLIWDQFATPKVANLSNDGWDEVHLFFGGDIDPAGADTPLVENLDVDSVTFTGRSVKGAAREYGRAVSRTRLANVVSRINIDPSIVDRVSFDGARAFDALAKAAFTSGSASYLEGDKTTSTASVVAKIDVSTGYLSSTVLQVAVSMLAKQNAMVFPDGNYVLLTNPVGAQHLKNERDTGGFRYITARNEGMGGNSTYRGTIGEVEGATVVVANNVPDGKAYLIAKDYVAKVYTNKEGYGAMPSSVVSPVIDKLRRFLSWGWLGYVGYFPYDTRAMLEIDYLNAWRPAGAKNIGADPTAATFVTGWPATFGPVPTAVPFAP